MRKFAARVGGYAYIIVSIALAIVVVVAIFWFLNRSHSAAKPAQTASLRAYCVGQTFAEGSSGHCVRDIQTLVNYMEHSGLTECPFTGGATLAISGIYDTATAAQVTSAQQWSGCYARQEGFTSNVPQIGRVNKATWGELCTYSYTDPLHSSASGANASIAAGKDAGCAHL